LVFGGHVDQEASVVRGGVSRAWIVDDVLWSVIEPLLPPWPVRTPGPRPVPDRLCLQGILYVLHTGIGWEDLPQELGYGCGMTCWRRLKRWTDTGVFDQVHRILLAELNAAGRIDWSRAVLDGSHLDAKKGARAPAVTGQPGQARQQTPPDLRRRRHPTPGHHDRWERPRRHPGGDVARRRAASPAGGVGPAAGSRRCWPTRATTAPRSRDACRARGSQLIIPYRHTTGIKGLGKLRYVVEQTLALLHQFRRLATRWEHRLDIHQSLVNLGCALICWRRLINHEQRSC
jgi:transposase